MMVHVVALDLKAPGLTAFVTPSISVTPSARSKRPSHTLARTTSVFANEFGLQLAINGNFFYPFHEDTPWDYYPHQGDRVWVSGNAISNTNPYPVGKNKLPAICFTKQKAEIVADGSCPTKTAQAIAGNEIFVNHAQPLQHPSRQARDWDKPYPRTAIGLDRSGTKVWLIVVDGKQPLYSEGATMTDLGEIAAQLGLESALNLDGGGSVTLAIATAKGPMLLNSPIHAKLPTVERPIANHLGFYANPVRFKNDG
ncbi:phosphodiester glycosidase family protein [Altericista sp. CCNU0014]|uniref:phosphodiester glycosidase family protein n=1 Tax=Altericista sp. CCNU0014 TaxID=3082949 RepID=UPI00384BF960